MLRRCLEGGRRFGVVSAPGGNLSNVGTIAEIQTHVPLPDGRSVIHTIGKQRFKLIKHWNQDGYIVANVTFMDGHDEIDEGQKVELEECKNYISTMFSEALATIEEKFGKMPNDPVDFTYWLIDFLPVTLNSKQSFLELQTHNERITALKHIINLGGKEASPTREKVSGTTQFSN